MEWIAPKKGVWDSILNQYAHDVYHLENYAMLSTYIDEGEALAAYCQQQENNLFFPMLVRDIPSHPSHQDAMSPYGYPGPLCSNHISVDRLADLWLQYIEKADLVTSFIRLHPFFSATDTLTAIFSKPTPLSSQLKMKMLGDCVAVDLQGTHDSIEKNISNNHRRGIKKLKTAGYTFSLNDWSRYDEFIHIYHQAMYALQASTYYHFSPDYFYALRDSLKDNLMLALVLDNKQQVCAAGLFFKCADVLGYHLGGTLTAARDKAPSKLMFYEMIQWGYSENYTHLHLGSGVGFKQDALFDFKKGFGDIIKPYAVLQVIHQQEIYEQLNLEAIARYPHVDFSALAFFPPYKFKC